MAAVVETLIDLLRHGEVENSGCYCGSSDVSLTQRGRQQMAQVMAREPALDGIITSPLVRCATPAREFSDQYGLPLVLDSALKEIHLGTWEGLKFSEVFTQWPDKVENFWRDPVNHPPLEGEPLLEFQRRVVNAFNHHINHCRGQRLLMVTHGGVIRIILAQVLKMPLTALLRLEVPYASLSRIRIGYEQDGTHSHSLVFHASTLLKEG